MNSEINLFLPAFSIIHDSVETGSKKLKKNKCAHTIWIHTRTARDRKDSRLKFYIYYIITPPYNILVNINMRGHFELKYEIIIDRTPSPI
jgi:hypothetical protein